MKKNWIAVLLAAVLCMTLAACGGNQPAEAGQSGGNDKPAQGQSQSKNWTISADEMQAVLERDYGYSNESELVDTDDENDRTHREETPRFELDGETYVEHFVDISYDGKTNEITGIGWYYTMQRSDLDYWMETLGLVIGEPDDLKFIRDVLSQDPIPAYKKYEISDASFTVQNFGDDEYRTLAVFLTRK